MDPMISDAIALHGVTALHPNRGQLRHGNPGGDPSSSPRCGARNRRGAPCGSPGDVERAVRQLYPLLAAWRPFVGSEDG